MEKASSKHGKFVAAKYVTTFFFGKQSKRRFFFFGIKFLFQKENFPVKKYDTKQCTITIGIPQNYYTFAACLNPPKPSNLTTLSIAGVVFSK